MDRILVQGSCGYSSDLTRKLVDDIFVLTQGGDENDPSAAEEEKQLVENLARNFEQLDKDVRQELADLATLLPDEQGHILRTAISRPGRGKIEVDADGMQAALTISGPAGGGKALTTADVVSLLRDAGVVFGVDLPGITIAVNEVVRNAGKAIRVCVATGKRPVNGEDGRLDIHVKNAPPQASARRRQWTVKKGDVVATRIPPTDGVGGTDVFGTSVPSTPGAEVPVCAWEGIAFDAERQEYLAAFDGMAFTDGKQIELRRQLVWNGDLTVHDAPIVFDGSVVIHGTVRDGARVTATEDIHIHEGVEGATVISTAGSVIIRQGIAGHGRSYVSAKNTVDAKYAENATVYSAGDILIRHAVLHSRLTAGGHVYAELGKGAIFGGDIRAGVLIVAKTLGNVTGVASRLSVGHCWDSLLQLQQCEADLATLRQKSVMCEELIAKFRHARPQLSSLSATEKQALGTLLKRHLLLKSRIEAQNAHYQTLDSGWVLETNGEIRCHETLYAGTVVKLGSATAHVALNHMACTLHLSREERRIYALSPAGRKTLL